MYSDPLATFVTTTSFGSWLPGDERGNADNGQLFPPLAPLAANVQQSMKQAEVLFSCDEQDRLFDALVSASIEFSYELTDAVVESTHLHWIIGHSDAVSTMVGRLKNRMRQRLNRGRIWTEGFSHRLLFNDDALFNARNYMTKHSGLRLIAGKALAASPGRAGGF